MIPIFKTFLKNSLRIIIGSLLFLLLATNVFAAITLDATSYSTGSGTDTFTHAHTVAVGSNLCLVVCINAYKSGVGAVTVSSMSYNGAAMTKAIGATRDMGVAGYWMLSEIWYLANPATGAHTWSVTFDHQVEGHNASINSLKGVKLTSQPDATASQSSASGASPYLTNITTVNNNSWIFDCINFGAGITVTGVGASQTQLSTNSHSYKATTTAGVIPMSWTYTGTDDNALHVLASFQPETATADTGGFFDVF